MPISSGTQATRGRIRIITQAAPSAGAEVIFVVPALTKWRVISFIAALTTSVTVANRLPTLIIDDGTNTLYRSSPHSAQTASLTWTYQYGGVQVLVAGVDGNLIAQDALLNAYLIAGSRLRTLTGAIQAGDQWSIPYMLVEEWIEP